MTEDPKTLQTGQAVMTDDTLKVPRTGQTEMNYDSLAMQSGQAAMTTD